jgi:hypothetical protein
MKLTVKQVRESLIQNLIDNGAKPTPAKTKINTIADEDLAVAYVSAGLNDPDNPLELDVIELNDDEPEISTGFTKPAIRDIIGQITSVRTFVVKDDNGNEVIDEAGDKREVCVMTIQRIGEKDVESVFITPKQLVGFALNQGKFVKVAVEVRRAHITQYETKQKEVKFHGRQSDPKGKIELAFITGNEYLRKEAMFNKLMSLPVEDRESARLAMVAFANMD